MHLILSIESMFRQRYHLILILLLTALLPASLLAKKKKDKMVAETSLLSLDEQHYFDSLYFLAITQEQCNRSDSAIKIMNQAVMYYDSLLASRGYQVRMKLPSVELDPKEQKKALPSPTSRQVPGLAAAYYFLSNQYRGQNDAMQTILNIEKAVAIDSVNYWYTDSEGDLYMALKEYSEARISYERLVRNYPEKSAPLYNMSEIYLRLDSIDLCLKTLNRLEELEGISPQLTRYKFGILQNNGRTEEGFAEYRKLIERYPYNVQYRLTLGDLQMQNGQIPQAKQMYDEASALDPDNAYVWIAMANYYSMTGDQEAADTLVASALTKASLDVETKDKVMLEYLKGSFRKLSLYREQIAKGNVSTELDTLKLFSNVDSLFSSVVAMHPTSAEFYALQSEWRSAMGHDSLAFESLRFAVDLKPASMEYWEKLLINSTTWKSKPEVIDICHEIMAQDSTCQAAYLVAAWAYVNMDDYDSAIEQYRLAIGYMTPPDASQISQLWSNIGDCHYQKKELQEAFECYDKAIKYNPSNYAALNNYAYYLSEVRQDLSKAEQMSLKVIQKYPDNPTYLDTYAWILYLEGSYTLAIFYQEQALQQLNGDDTGNGTLYDHYGDMLFKNKDMNGAVEQWKKALECKDNEKAEEIQKKIESAETLLKLY